MKKALLSTFGVLVFSLVFVSAVDARPPRRTPSKVDKGHHSRTFVKGQPSGQKVVRKALPPEIVNRKAKK